MALPRGYGAAGQIGREEIYHCLEVMRVGGGSGRSHGVGYETAFADS